MKSGQTSFDRGHGGAVGSVAASYASALLDAAQARGAARAPLLAQAGLREDGLAPPTQRVPVAALLRLFDAARTATGEEFIGLHMGRAARPRMFSALGHAAMSCRTLGEAIALIPRYEDVVYAGATTTVARSGGAVTLAWRPALSGCGLRRLQPLNEAIVAGWLGYGRWIAAIRGELRAVRFQHPAPSSLAEYREFFGCTPQFEADDNALVFDAALLAAPLVQHDDELRRVMEQQAQTLMRQLRARAPLSQRVIGEIRARLPRGRCGAGPVAGALGLSERSLRRLLRAEGAGFKDLLAQVRQELAQIYLADAALSVLDVALLLGYAEQSAFSAAFKDWTGMSPRQFQARAGGSA